MILKIAIIPTFQNSSSKMLEKWWCCLRRQEQQSKDFRSYARFSPRWDTIVLPVLKLSFLLSLAFDVTRREKRSHWVRRVAPVDTRLAISAPMRKNDPW